MTATSMARIAQALGDPTRLRIFTAIAGGGQPCCGDLCRETGVSAPTMTHHVRVLRRAGLIEGRRDGAYFRVWARPETLEAYRAALARIAPAGRTHRRNTA